MNNAPADMRPIAVIRDYDDFYAAVRTRAEQVNVTRETMDEGTEMPAGYSGKLLAPTAVRAFGRRSLGPMLKMLKLAIVLVEESTSAEVAATLPQSKRQRRIA